MAEIRCPICRSSSVWAENSVGLYTNLGILIDCECGANWVAFFEWRENVSINKPKGKEETNE